ncbi:hypothetical protein BDR06DRAFT_973291 [Suillus hirtellus]|nr:hypothetical protein BDR06DRAFT_973291 [Suillus hirtellus]
MSRLSLLITPRLGDDEIQVFEVECMEHVLLEETAVKNELNNLRSHTRAEAILYAIRGSMDLPLHGVTFTTEGVEEFMTSVMNIDNQDLISKMEGFIIQGIKGFAKNHQKCCSNVYAMIHQQIQKELVEITKDEGAKMHWMNYF